MDKIMKSLSEVEANRSVIPESCLSFSEMSDYIALYAIKEFNEMNSVLTESSDASSIKDHIVKVWSADKAYWEKVLAESKSQVSKAKSIKVTAIDIDKLEDKVYGKCHTYTKLADVKFDRNAANFAREVKKVFTSISLASDTKAIKEARNILEGDICKEISGFNDVKSNRDIKSKLTKELMGGLYKADKAFLKRHINKMNKVITTSTTDEIKAAYNGEKRVYAELLRQLNEVDADLTKIANAWGSMLTETLTVLHKCYAVEMDVCTRRFKEYVNILGKVATAKASAVKESAEVEAPKDKGTDTLNLKGSLDEIDDKKADIKPGKEDKTTDQSPENESDYTKNCIDASIKESLEVLEERVKIPGDMKITDEDFWSSAQFKTKFKALIQYLIDNNAKEKELGKIAYESYLGNIGTYFANQDYDKKYAPKLVFLADYVNKYPTYKKQIVKDLQKTIAVEGKANVKAELKEKFLAYQKAYMVDAKGMLAKLQ